MVDPIGYPSRYDVGYREGDGDGAGAALVPLGYVEGLKVLFTSVNAVDILAGACRDANDAGDIIYDGALPLQANLNLAGAGGLDTGARAASTWYHLYIIENPSSGAQALLWSIQPVTPTLPLGYTRYRRLGAFYNGPANTLYDFRQYGAGKDREVQFLEDVSSTTRILTSGAATVWTQVSTAAVAPVTAERIYLMAQEAGSQQASVRFFGSTVTWFRRIRNANTNYFTMPITGSQRVEYNHPSGLPGGSLNLSGLGYSEEI